MPFIFQFCLLLCLFVCIFLLLQLTDEWPFLSTIRVIDKVVIWLKSHAGMSIICS